jgi:hypothetical protein
VGAGSLASRGPTRGRKCARLTEESGASAASTALTRQARSAPPRGSSTQQRHLSSANAPRGSKTESQPGVLEVRDDWMLATRECSREALAAREGGGCAACEVVVAYWRWRRREFVAAGDVSSWRQCRVERKERVGGGEGFDGGDGAALGRAPFGGGGVTRFFQRFEIAPKSHHVQAGFGLELLCGHFALLVNARPREEMSILSIILHHAHPGRSVWMRVYSHVRTRLTYSMRLAVSSSRAAPCERRLRREQRQSAALLSLTFDPARRAAAAPP